MQNEKDKAERLKVCATEYVADKAEESKLKKRLESNNSEIKELMQFFGQDEVELDDGTRVVYSVTQKTSLDEEKLLIQLKKYAPDTKCIKTKEYIDMDILENEIYHEKLSAEALSAMDSCRNVKEVPTLNIRKAKKGKE